MTIQFKNFSFRYDAQVNPTLKNIYLTINQGEKVLILGPSGSGKSTLAQCINGLIPHCIEGEIHGELSINGHSFHSLKLEDYTASVGTVLQDTDSQFVGLTVGEDIAFALENQCVPTVEMYPLVKKTAKMVDLEALLHLSPQDLSGGQKQRVSLAGILVDDVDILLFDEPLAALDPVTAKRTIEIIDQLHLDTQKTVIIVEHRLEDVLHKSVDRVIVFDRGEIVADTSADQLLASGILTDLGIREPLYLSALKKAGADLSNLKHSSNLDAIDVSPFSEQLQAWDQPHQTQDADNAEAILRVEHVSYSYDGERLALNDVNFTLNKGEMISILGKNGSGKSTLTKLIMGAIKPDSGEIWLSEKNIGSLSMSELSQKVGVVLQNPNHMISHHMIHDEVAFGLKNKGFSQEEINERVTEILTFCGLRKFRHWPVDALSYGQKKRVTIASILVMEPDILILDEPTAGQDHRNYSAMLDVITRLSKEKNISIVLISHDLHLVLEHTQRAIVIADSKVIADAPTSDVFSQPALLNQANLTTTSIYDLAEKVGIKHINGFIQQFIQTESHA